jgi:hypothetical protein
MSSRHENGLLCDQFPRLFLFAIDEDATVADFGTTLDLISKFRLPLSVQAFEELQQIQLFLDGLVLDPAAADSRVFPWGNSIYTSAKYYNFVFDQVPKNPTMQSIWKSKSLPKLRVFTWLLSKDRLNTKDLMLRKHWTIDDGPTCVLCSRPDVETRDHLFFQCSFAASCWNCIGISWDCT